MTKPLKNALITLGIICVVFTVVGLIINRDFASFLINVSTEIIGIIITVLIIDRIVQNHEVKAKKDLLLLRMGSHNNETAKEAINELRLNGWLKDGSLNGVQLTNANLSDANLDNAVMIGSVLSFAVFERAHLYNATLTNAITYFTSFRNAELRGANLTGMKDLFVSNYPGIPIVDHRVFANVFSLRKAIMPDGTIYDGRYRLKGDIDTFHGILSSPSNSLEFDTGQPMDDSDESWATFYGVTFDEYRQGQLWAETHLDKTRRYTAPPNGYNFNRDEN